MDSADQIFLFLLCATAGIFSGTLYEVFFIVRKMFRKMAWVGVLCDIAFFVCFSILCVLLSVRFTFPDFRVYMYAGYFLGLALYLKSIHIIVAFFLKMCYNKIREVIKKRKIGKNSGKKEVHSV